MRHLKMIGLCILAAFVFGALAASAAQASGPEWGRCVKLAKKKGKYEDSNCTKEQGKLKGPKPLHFVAQEKGEYEWLAGAEAKCYSVKKKAAKYADAACTEVQGKLKGPKPIHFVPQNKGEYELTSGGPKFTGEGTTPGTLTAEYIDCEDIHAGNEDRRVPKGPANCAREESTGEISVECTEESSHGEATGTNGIANVRVLFKNCAAFGVIPCNSAGKGSGEIETTTLDGRLGYVEPGAPHVGVLLEPAAAPGPFAEFECEEIGKDWVAGVGNATEGAAYSPEATGGYDGVISPITPVNAMSEKFEQNYTINANFENIPSKFDEAGAHIELLESYFDNAPQGEPELSSEWSKAGESITNVVKTEGMVEIKG